MLDHLREECFSTRFQGGEPLLYPHITELARYAKERLRFRNLSIITNGLPLARHPEQYRELLGHLDIVTLSIDGTRLAEYPDEMDELMTFLPALKKLCSETRTGLTSNYTATWEELADPGRIERQILRYQPWIPYFYVMPVRKVGKTPLALLKNAQILGRKYSMGFYGGPDYPDVENVPWYQASGGSDNASSVNRAAATPSMPTIPLVETSAFASWAVPGARGRRGSFWTVRFGVRTGRRRSFLGILVSMTRTEDHRPH